ncbi:hypothetical protein LWI29_026478 [Acer saccharum]|uniref:Uncharacterized protein n=1 Tax=Acer saccharum TaxID=4024 RepID=A0AA39SG70_ACESA|nr:hypothetical protein LWI29_026478 [Acer saccharum]
MDHPREIETDVERVDRRQGWSGERWRLGWSGSATGLEWRAMATVALVGVATGRRRLGVGKSMELGFISFTILYMEVLRRINLAFMVVGESMVWGFVSRSMFVAKMGGHGYLLVV